MCLTAIPLWKQESHALNRPDCCCNTVVVPVACDTSMERLATHGGRVKLCNGGGWGDGTGCLYYALDDSTQVGAHVWLGACMPMPTNSV